MRIPRYIILFSICLTLIISLALLSCDENTQKELERLCAISASDPMNFTIVSPTNAFDTTSGGSPFRRLNFNRNNKIVDVAVAMNGDRIIATENEMWLEFNPDEFLFFPAPGGMQVTGFGFAILSDIEAFFFIEAAQANTRVNILQAPKVTLFDGQQAFVADTVQRPFVTSLIPVVGGRGNGQSDEFFNLNIVDPELNVPLFSIDCVDNETCWTVGAEGNVYKSGDDGRTWTKQESGTNNDLNNVYILDENSAWAVGDQGTVIKTTDGGGLWQPVDVNTLSDLNQVSFERADMSAVESTLRNIRITTSRGIIIGNDGLVRVTEDGGNTWEDVGIEAMFLFALKRFHQTGNRGLLVGDGGSVFTTDDFGKTFSRVAFVKDFDVEVAMFEAIADPQVPVLTGSGERYDMGFDNPAGTATTNDGLGNFNLSDIFAGIFGGDFLVLTGDMQITNQNVGPGRFNFFGQISGDVTEDNASFDTIGFFMAVPGVENEKSGGTCNINLDASGLVKIICEILHNNQQGVFNFSSNTQFLNNNVQGDLDGDSDADFLDAYRIMECLQVININEVICDLADRNGDGIISSMDFSSSLGNQEITWGTTDSFNSDETINPNSIENFFEAEDFQNLGEFTQQLTEGFSDNIVD